MRINALVVDGFGVWSNLELAELSDDLNVFYGPNEAGKTTLVEFVRSMFWGFSPARRAQYLPPVRGGRPGGSLHASVGPRNYTVTRHADTPGDVAEALLCEDGQDVHDHGAWTNLLGGVDEATFTNVFVFGLREIQELGTLSDTKAADELYNLALGLDRVSLSDVLADLETSRTRLLAADGRPSLVTQLLNQRDRLRSEIDVLSQATPRYLALEAERKTLDGEVARLDAESARLEEHARELALARALGERWQRRAAIDERLKGLVGCEKLPDDALTRFDQIEARLRIRRRKLARIKDERRELRNQIQQLNINEPLCRQALRLEALAEQQQWITSLETRLSQLEAEIARLDGDLAESYHRFGVTAGAGSRTLKPLASQARDELRTAARELRQARRDTRRLKADMTAAGTKAEGLSGQLAATLTSAGKPGLTDALADAGELVSRLRNRVQIEERIDQLTRRESELEEQSHDHLDGQLLPTWILTALGVLFVFGCAMVLLFVAGFILPASISGSLGWPVGLFGVLAIGASAGAKLAMERSASRDLDNCHAQLQMLGEQLEETKAERDELDAQLPKGGGPLVSRLQTAEKELARLEELLPLESQRDAAERESKSVRERAESRRADLRRLRKEWQRLLARHALPAELAPNELSDYFGRRQALDGLEATVAERRDELARLRGQYESMADRIVQVAIDVGLADSAQRPLDQLRRCLSELAEQRARQRQRDELERGIDRLGRRYTRASVHIDRLRHRRERLLRAAGTSDEAEFRRRAQAQAEATELAAQRARLAEEITAALADRFPEDKLAGWMSDTATLEHAEAALAEARQAVAGELSGVHETRGQIHEQIKSLVLDRQLGTKRIELGVVEKRLHDALGRWRVLTVCRAMLEAVRDYYEREHQPEALREASGYLKRMTSGRYTRVWTPLGEHTLRVDDAKGATLGVDVLSRGTREQLFLALRLALVSAYARRGVLVPLVLDDVLVNFDVARAKAAATVLRDFARAGHQVLIFTCHEHISKLFQKLKSEVRVLPDNSAPEAVAAEPRRARRPRVEPAAKPGREEPAPEVIEPEPEVIETEIEPDEEPIAPAPVVEAPPPPPQPVAPQPAAPRRRLEGFEWVQWSAEEFEGELRDRVRREHSSDDSAEPADTPPHRDEHNERLDDDEDADAA